MKPIKVGDKMPIFGAKDQDGNNFYIESVLHKKILVIYFYPKDETPGCTKQACSFRDEYEDIKNAGAEVIGISSDSPNSHKKFAQNHKLPYTLLSDNDKNIRKLFGVPSAMLGLIPGRVTYVIDLKGTVQMVYNNLNASQHIPKSLEAIQKLK
ncbi:peroxiredoxin [Flavobacterium psychrophilum]|jgi:peroxiredoxin Q/BCP|uniref:thioredoxin-dependent peroxiredoxin n=2 Tax=Flavobacterium psychrophilum TaxID=96345 RepID=A6H0I3_FLAPJ|nr:peroxiredoxin [Flavobacterium psychrophilum]AIG30540.1 alkyl hydroperoxide reductase [Flavobacterium psychrophilum]AIG32815.1 alkyl hydroperoxide reductase [Flavobacterium psychrophilum]AIG34970.1 alkyl hydroperoxide reductase [Flavobacterium psychrophilum]AIG37335.1 alkyl hydroperoxide reductase [Flavobacterium psychrophilum]AIG39599.1 alkyl hydroperoxide reductase [Flavobacterium psychrophilum]